MVILNLTPPEIQQLIESAVHRSVQLIIMEQNRKATRYLNIQEAAAYLSLSIPTLRKLVHEGGERKIPCIRPNKKLLFAQDELDKWMKTYRG